MKSAQLLPAPVLVGFSGLRGQSCGDKGRPTRRQDVWRHAGPDEQNLAPLNE